MVPDRLGQVMFGQVRQGVQARQTGHGASCQVIKSIAPFASWVKSILERLGKRLGVKLGIMEEVKKEKIHQKCSCCVFQPGNWCFIHHSQVKIICFSILTSFSATNGKKKKIKMPKKIKIHGKRGSTSVQVLFPNAGRHPKTGELSGKI